MTPLSSLARACLSFRRKRQSRRSLLSNPAVLWIPALAGMTRSGRLDSRLSAKPYSRDDSSQAIPMKEFFLRFFTWWSGATLGTLFFTRRFGELVGHDEFGNSYYRSI